MSGAASTASLHELHRKLADQMLSTLKRDIEDDVPTDAATMSVIKGFLKDNNITCDPADRDSTSKLAEQFKEQARIREERKQQALALVKAEDIPTGT
ncbi:terminase small subunit [Ralstonia phage phiAp1]|uniref:TerS subunit n=1 Tax=Ralstonia phage phiAp1 TaxID=2783867 RepID=A0A1L7DS64_9CAUD|nr:terminase small subunit [Ralstonia phage phiAp1]APU03189.1 TerS subunit [Ralstonia phage phiAp1]